MTQKSIRTVLPIPPLQYDVLYINQLVRALDVLISEVRNPDVNIPNTALPTVGVANTLAIGDLFEDDSTLRVVRAEDKHSGSFSVTGSVGTVTVVTP
jgi:hypothetical protein|tara:strand:+ start:509 stop:799 length:291 start_codon:yes stop_codon:yes gene_type:complete